MTRRTLWHGCKLATLQQRGGDPWGIIDDALIATENGHVAWIGARADCPREISSWGSHDLGGACVTPALIDCHTHLVYAGSRAREFEMRLEGATYESIARAGGGIRATVNATRAANEDELYELACRRASVLMREGVATIEVKSGYGLSEADERKCLRAARRLSAALGINVRTTYLAAHAVPDEFEGRSDEYVDAVCDWMRQLHREGLIDAVDAFCERIGFTPAQTRRVFERAKSLGLPVKLHAEQLSDQGGAALASEFGALSCDHLEYLSDAGIDAMARQGVTAVLLPGAYYFLRETQLPPLQKLRDAGVPIALATDHNPGSSPTLSPLLMMNMASTLFRMTPLEAWRGFTSHAARALGLSSTHGEIAMGRAATFAVWHCDHPRELAYQFGQPALKHLVLRGAIKETAAQ